RAGRGPRHRAHHRAVPQRRACRCAYAQRRTRTAHNVAGAYAPVASATCRVADRTDRPGGNGHRARDGDADDADPAEQATSGARLPGLPRRSAAGAQLRPGTAGGGLLAWARDRRPLLRQRAVDPATRTRSPLTHRQQRCKRTAAAASEHSWFRLLSLKENRLLTHPTLEQLRQLGLVGMARAFGITPPSKMSITARHVGSIARCSRSWHRAAGSRNSRT